MDLQLKGKIALITGASQGLGFAVAKLLAQEGANIGINSRDSANLESAIMKIDSDSQSRIVPLPGDITEPNTPGHLIDEIHSAFGGLDILVTNSGGPPSMSFEDIDDNTWYEAVELSFMSHVRLIRSALPYLRLSKTPSVLTITSISVKQPVPNLILSNSIRSATVGLTKTLALELGSDGIRFNSILPGWTETERVTELLSFRAQKNRTTIEEEKLKQSHDSPFKRMATPEEFAHAAVFLVSPIASYITGVMLPVDGGMYKGTI
ncbi:MAG: SDR family oxidoreductase [Anaerolineaceae bacterium]|nr:SDR family oxidoreductase [Anaerolineaceae bacterium]